MRIHRDERGQTILLVAFSLPILLGFIGIATDVGALFKDKRTMQTAADAAAIAAALNYNYGATVWKTAARAAATSNGFTDGSNSVTVTTPDTPTWPASNYVGKTGYVEVTITKSEPTIFLTLFGYPSVNVLARAVATNGPGTNCVYTGIVSPGSPPPPGPVLTVTGSMQSLPPRCGLIVDSTNSPPITVAGALDMSAIGTIGDCAGACGSGITPLPVPNIIPYSDPLSFLPPIAPSGSCTNALNATGGTVSLSPGCYTTFNETGANVTLSPGTYVINGTGPTGLNFTGGTVSGTGVTFYISSGSVNINNTTFNVSAPTSGTYNGILFAQSPSNTSAATINGLPTPTLQGIFYFPAASLNILNVTGGTIYTGFVAQSLAVTGSLIFNNYSSAPGVTSWPLGSAVLVE